MEAFITMINRARHQTLAGSENARTCDERKKLNRRRFFHDRLRAFAVMEYWAQVSQTASTRQIMENSALRFIDDQRPLFTDIADGLR